MGNGQFIIFWEDKWIGDAPLCECAPRLYRLCSYKNGAIHSF